MKGIQPLILENFGIYGYLIIHNEKEHKFNRVLYIKIDFYDTDNSWYASRDNYIKDGSCNVRLGLGPGGPNDCSEEFPLLRRLKDAEKLKALIEILKGGDKQ